MPVARRRTSHLKIFKRSGSEAVIYDLSQPNRATITLPVGSRWTSQPHWHEHHTEFLQILQGRAFVRLGNQAGVLGPEDGVIEVPTYTVHEWRRAGQNVEEQDLIVREWTVPEDGQKEVFFRNLNSFLTESQPSCMYEVPALTPSRIRRWIESWIISLQLFCIFRSWDNWVVLVGDDNGWLSWLVTHVVLAASSAVGLVLGLRGMYREYVDEELISRATGKNDTRRTR